MAYTPTEWTNGEPLAANKFNKMENGLKSADSSYVPTEWTPGDVITAEALNKIENGIAAAGSGGGMPNNLSAFILYDTTGTPTSSTTRHVYFFESGMTWEDFIASDYNNGDFHIYYSQVQTISGHSITGCFGEYSQAPSDTLLPTAVKWGATPK